MHAELSVTAELHATKMHKDGNEIKFLTFLQQQITQWPKDNPKDQAGNIKKDGVSAIVKGMLQSDGDCLSQFAKWTWNIAACQ